MVRGLGFVVVGCLASIAGCGGSSVNRVESDTTANVAGTARCDAAQDSSAAEEALRSREDAIRGCVEDALARTHTSTVELVLGIRIGATGAVIGVDATGTPNDDTMLACITRLVTETPFPPPASGRCEAVRVPVRVRPADAVAADEGPAPPPAGYVNQVREAIRGRARELRACFETRMQERGDTFVAQVTIDFEVRGTGDVSRVQVSSEPVDPSFVACLSRVAQSVRFGAVPGGNPFRYRAPFEFRPSETAAPTSRH